MPRTRPTSEFQRIAAIQRELARVRIAAPRIELGIGDDAAVLAPLKRSVWTVDTQVEGVHFRRDWLTLEDVGYRAVQAAASDLAAMAARPIGALVSLTLPPEFSDRDLALLSRGQALAARDCGCPVVGGNLSRAPCFTITTTLLGEARRPLLRSTARVGDELWLFGELGLSALGLRALMRGLHRSRGLAPALQAWRRPRAQIAAGIALQGRAHAGLDISDGFSGDAAHLAKASGVRVRLDAELLEATFSAAYRDGARRLGLEPLALALSGGEDYALLATGPRARRPRAARVIGSIERGRGVVVWRDNKRLPPLASHDHFSR